MNWLKRLWSRVRGDVIVRKSGGRPMWAIEQSGVRHHRRPTGSLFYTSSCGCNGCFSRRSDEEIDTFMENMINKIKKVSYMTGSGDYSLRFNLQTMPDGWTPIRDNEGSGSV